MTRWQLTGLVVGAAALLFTARPARAQVWVGRPAPIVVARPPIVVGRPTPVWPVPPVGVVPGPVVVGPDWGARPRDVRRAYRAARRGGWYGPAWVPPGGVVVAGRRW